MISRIKNFFKHKHTKDYNNFRINYLVQELYRLDDNSYANMLEAYNCLSDSKIVVDEGLKDEDVLILISKGIKKNNINIECDIDTFSKVVRVCLTMRSDCGFKCKSYEIITDEVLI